MSFSDEINNLPVIPGVHTVTGVWYAEQPSDVQAAFDKYVERVDRDNPVWWPLYELCRQHGLTAGRKAFREWIVNHWEDARGSR